MKSLFSKQKNKREKIYLDHAAATPLDPEVSAAMQSDADDSWYNPNALYQGAISVRNRIETSRINVAHLLKARSSEIYFTDGATEANNIALLGVISAWKKQNPEQKAHVITTLIEHPSVLETCRFLEERGTEATYLSVDKNGHIDIKELKKNLKENTVLVSIGYANGEIGSIQDIRGIAKTLRHARKQKETSYPYFHTDAVQAVNYLPMGVTQLGIDLMTINAAKIYGPKKSGVLYIKSGTEIDPIMFGGSQEFGLRPGTENPSLIFGMEKSLERALGMQESESLRLAELRTQFIAQIESEISNVHINAHTSEVLPNIVNISIPDISSEEIVLRLDAVGIMASIKSACKSGEDGDSHVIVALRGENQENTGSIRFSMGRETKKSHIDRTVTELAKIVSDMRETSKKYYQD